MHCIKCVSQDISILRTQTNTHACTRSYCSGAAGESSTPAWQLKASMPGVLPPFFFWVTDPPHTHMLFKFKEENIRGRRERRAWASTHWMQSHRPRTVYCGAHHTRHHSSKLIAMVKTVWWVWGFSALLRFFKPVSDGNWWDILSDGPDKSFVTDAICLCVSFVTTTTDNLCLGALTPLHSHLFLM